MNGPIYRQSAGFTLIEVVAVIVIIGILVGVAVQNGGHLFESARVEETRQEMDALATAIAGNPTLENNGVRSDFGYVGDVGALPPDLDALHSNPGGYITWNGPYIANRFTQIADDYKKDPWGAEYSYSGGAAITSTGSGSNIVRQVANSTDDLLYNRFSGNVRDSDGTPPGTEADSIVILITLPNGTGGTVTRGETVDRGGYFEYDSLPIGNHDLQIVYRPTDDTLRRFVSITPGSALYGEYRLASNFWYSSGVGGALIKVPGSDSLVSDCHGFYFWIKNSTGAPIDINSITIDFSSPTAFYRYVRWDGTVVFNVNNPSPGSGDAASFTSPQTINDGESLRIELDAFRSNPTGGPNVDIDNTTFTVTLSDGTTFDVTTGACP